MLTPARSAQRLRWPFIAAAFALLALAVMAWRWGGTVADSLAYFNTARYFRGELPLSALEAPFPYRSLMPGLAALLPGELHNSFAILNWLSVSAAALMASMTLVRLELPRERAIAGGLMLILSVPTFWYAPYLLVDPGSLCARAAFVLAVVAGQPWLAAGAGLVGTAVREENILLLVWLVAARRIAPLPGLLVLAAGASWILTVRWYLIPGLPSYIWTPGLDKVLRTLGDQRAMLSLAAGAGVVLPLALLGMRRAAPRLRPLLGLLALMALPPLYAFLCVRVDGRAIWGLYPFLIPFAAALGWPKSGKPALAVH
ncbi:MAG: hypothetical protein V4723_02500 [Pseudomonadota bacterium]